MYDDILHIIPLNDTKVHNEVTERTGAKTIANGDVLDVIVCKCECCTKIIYEENKAIVVHNAFDGRLGIEWANEILNKKQ